MPATHSTATFRCRGVTDVQLQLAERGTFAMPTTALHLLQPANGTRLPPGEDVVVQFDVPMPGASAVLVRLCILRSQKRPLASQLLSTLP